MMYIVFLKITTFLWVILIFYPGYTSLILEIVTVTFGGAEKNKYTTFKTSINAWVFSDQISSLPRQL